MVDMPWNWFLDSGFSFAPPPRPNLLHLNTPRDNERLKCNYKGVED